MSTSDHDHRAQQRGSDWTSEAARLPFERTKRWLRHAKNSIATAVSAIEHSRKLLAQPVPSPLPRAIIVSPEGRDITARSSAAIPVGSLTALVSLKALDECAGELQRAELEYAERLLAMGMVFDKLMVSMTADVLREEEMAKAAHDRAAVRLRELEERCLALRAALALEAEAIRSGPPPRHRLS